MNPQGSGVYPCTQNSRECSLAVWPERHPEPLVYLGTIPQRLGGPTGEKGNLFQEIFFHLVVYSFTSKRPSQTQLLKVSPWGLSLASLRKRLYKVAAPIAFHFLEGNQRRFFRKPVFVHLNASCPTFMY